MYTTDKRLYVNKTMTRIVPEDSEEAAFLFAAAGDSIKDEDARRLGLLGPAVKVKAAEPESKQGVADVVARAVDGDGAGESTATVTEDDIAPQPDLDTRIAPAPRARR